MQKPLTPTNEEARLGELHSLQLLDTASETEFDQIVALASYITDCPVSLISLVDFDRQWFKAKIGIEDSETHRDLSFCGHAIHHDELFVVEDTLDDERFRDNPLVTDAPHIRFYAGQPLITEAGYRLGTLCVIDLVPRRLSPRQAQMLSALSLQVMSLIELRANKRKLESVVTELNQEKELRERFVAALTHDLRTPLTAAKMSAELLKRKPNDSESVLKQAARIMSCVDRAETMVRDLLDANRIKAGEGIPLSIGECKLGEVVNRTVNELRNLIGDRFEVRDDVGELTGHWDGEALRRVVENLASNAVKYGEPNAPVSIGLYATPEFAEIAVHNRGEPIAEVDQAYLFESYRRTDSAIASGQKGWGIGLTLVKGIAEAHRGQVRVESAPQSGTTFYVRLPLDARLAAQLS